MTHLHLLYLVLTICLVTFIYQIYYPCHHHNHHHNHKHTIEGFNSSCEGDSLYQRRLKEILVDSPKLLCLLDTKNIDCKTDDKGDPIDNNMIPVHIIRDVDEGYLAVFSDGLLYKNDNIKSENLWRGPLENSQIKSNIRLQNVTYNRDGYLMGIGTDNKLYIKSDWNIESPWRSEPVANSGCVTYVMYDKDRKLLGLDAEGKLMKKAEEDITSEWLYMDNDLPLLKIFWDISGHLLGLGSDFKLHQKKLAEWEISEWKPITSKDMLVDILYDTDGRLYGIVFNPLMDSMELMKQNVAYYTADFYPLIDVNPKGISRMTVEQIFVNKMGSNMATGVEQMDNESNDEPRDPSLEEIRQQYILDDQKKMRELCIKKKQYNKTNYQDFKLQHQIEEQDKLISNLKKELNHYSKVDPRFSQMEDREASYQNVMQKIQKDSSS